MEITIDKEIRPVDDNCSIEQLITALFPHQPKGIAVAVNEFVVPKADWKDYILQSNDKLILIKATQGG